MFTKNQIITVILLLICVPSFSQFIKKPGFISQDIFQTDYFIENKGQFIINDNKQCKVEYGVDHMGMNILFHKAGFVWNLRKVVDKRTLHKHEEENEREEREHDFIIHEDKLQMNWIESNPKCKIFGEQKSEHYFPYGDVNMNSYGYKKIRYQNLYPHINIDYVFHPKGGLKYSLLLEPGFDLSKVKFEYKNHRVTLKNNTLRIHTSCGNIIERELVAFYEDGTPIQCSFTLQNQKIGFRFLEAVLPNKKIIIDPWLTPITTLTNTGGLGNNRGFDVDYDYAGNLYVFGGGDYDGFSNSKVAKYSPTGVLLWTFNGVVVSTGWTSGAGIGKVSNFVVDKLSGKTYMGQGYVSGGAVIIRLNTNGNYDSFSSVANPNYQEIWEMNFDCSNGNILGFGGGTTTNTNLGVINLSGSFSMSNLSGAATGLQDILHSTISSSGEIFVSMACGVDPTLNNVIIRVNNTLNGNLWMVPSGLSSFSEADNKPYLSPYASNGFNVLYANKNYLYYYDGSVLKAFNKNTGSAVGITYTIPSYVLKFQGGIYVDECDNVYVGGNNGNLKVFHFDGTNFNALSDINIAGANNKHVYDIKYNSSNDMLYISGESFVSQQNRSQVCVDTTTLNATLITDCIHAYITLGSVDPSSQYTYIWTDSTTNTVVQNHSGTGMGSDSLNNIVLGDVYHVLVIKNALCGGSSQVFSFIGANIITVNNNPIICNGQSITVNGHTYTNTGVYLDTIQASVGCDTVIHTNLSVQSSSSSTQSYQLCLGQQIVVNGHSYSSSGVYVDTMQAQSGCDSIITSNVFVNPIKYTNLNMILCNGNTFSINNHTYSITGKYVDTLLSSAGCDSIVTTTIKVDSSSAGSFYVPNAFSPNGDHMNDCFGLSFWPPVDNFNLIIYNRWGQQLFATSNKNDCWNGKYKNQYVDLGVYFYYITAKSECGNIIKKGDLSVIR